MDPTMAHFFFLPTKNFVRGKKRGLSNMQIASGWMESCWLEGWAEVYKMTAPEFTDVGPGRRDILAGGRKLQGLLTGPRP